MSNKVRLYYRMILLVSFIFSFSVTTSAQSKNPRQVQDHTSNIVVSGTAEGTNVTFTGHSGFAGVITGTLNSVAQKFYCIDLNHGVNPSAHPTYWDEGSTPSEMTYILNNYFPFNTTNYSGKLADVNKEAAAIQIAIWHFSDNVDISSITDAAIKSRVTAIVNDANANHNDVQPFETLIIVPPAQSFVQGTPANFDVYALDLNSAPMVGLNVAISSSLGSLSQTSGNTNSNGKIGPVTLTYGGIGTATITAQATVQLPQGTVYVDKSDPTGKQRLVLATPTTDTKQVTATVEWYTKPLDCDTKGFTTFTQGGWGSPSNSGPGQIRDQYFSTVFPSGLVVGNPSGNYHLNLTSATAVKNYLPDGGTAAAYTQNYSNPTSQINVLSGQLVALKLNVAYSAAGKLGSNTTHIGDLVFASGSFVGMTVNQFLAKAEQAIGGGSLSGFTLAQYNDAATGVNENFDGGTKDNGYLTCAQVCENSLGSYVYHDLNANGTKDSGEAGIPNVVVELVKNSSVIGTSTTDLNGKYSFTNIPNGTYTVRIAASNFISGGVFFNTNQTKWYTKNSASVNTSLNCNDNLSINFGYYKTCVTITKTADKASYKKGDTITFTFKVDNCGDIQLHGGIDIYDQMLAGSNILKHIDILNPGATTSFTQTYVTSDKDCGDITNTARAEGHPVDGSATVVSESSVTVNVDCSTACKSSIGDFVWHDVNHNGIQDSGELGIPGVKVDLLQGSTIIANTTTDIDGHYTFADELNGTYKVQIDASNFQVGGALYSNSQTKWYPSPNNTGSKSTTLNCASDLSLDFGYYKTCLTITKTADKASYNKGETITFTFVVQNCGDVQLHGGIDIYDAMLAGTSIMKHIDVLDAGASTSFTETYVTGNNDCGQITNTARAEGHPVDGSATVIDESSVTVTVVCVSEKADIKIEKSVDNPNPQCDANVTFTIKATNLGPNDASNIVVMDQLPAGLNFISSAPSQGSYDNTTGLWTVGNLANGAYATLMITVKVDCGTANNSTFDLGAAKDFNLFVIEDLNQPSSDTQGKVAVGHNATLSTYSVGDKLPANSGDVLIVGNDLNFTSGAVYNGNVVYGHASNLPQSSVSISGGSLRKDNVIDFAAAKNSLQAMSISLSSYTVNGTTSFQWGGLTLTGTDPFLNVFNVSGSDLSSANSFSVNVPNGAGVLVNISGTNVNWTGGLVVNGTAINNVLYNFYQATTLKIQGIDIRGSILAPFAAVNFVSGVQNGQMICYSLTGMGQFNYVSFDGHIPYDEKITNVASIITSSPLDENGGNNTGSATVTIGGSGNGGNNGGNTGGNTGGNNGGSNGGNWQSVCSFGDGSIVYSLIYDGSNIYAGTWGGKIFKSSDNGKTWVLFNAGMDASFIWSLNISGGYMFAATEKGVYVYNGSTWALTSLSGKDCHTITSYNGMLYAGTWGFGVYVSSDFGSTWTEMNAGFSAFLTIQALTVTSNGDVFAGTVGGGIFKLAHGTTTWAKLTCGNVWSLGATSSAILAGTYGDGLYRSLDNGGSWTKLTSLDIQFVYSISVDASGKIYASSLTNGVEVSSDNGTTWSNFGLGGSGVSSLMVIPSTNTVFAGTKSGTLYAVSEIGGTTGVADNNVVPTEFSLSQNYPNPFNPTTTIQFSIPAAGRYSLKVYNVLGQEVANLVDNDLSTGVHSVTFDASRIASGMYIYRLSGNNVSMTKKMILMK